MVNVSTAIFILFMQLLILFLFDPTISTGEIKIVYPTWINYTEEVLNAQAYRSLAKLQEDTK